MHDLNIAKNKLAQIEASIKGKNEEIDALKREFKELKIPPNGASKDFKIIEDAKKSLLFNINQEKSILLDLKEEKEHFQAAYKSAYIELEKVKYMHKIELKNREVILKKQEQKLNDEHRSKET
ncbi:MAG: flagellar export protein FliJ [Helicobacter sp.]|nr:flagellar export protein FliJ [Helicobacter sp.]